MVNFKLNRDLGRLRVVVSSPSLAGNLKGLGIVVSGGSLSRRRLTARGFKLLLDNLFLRVPPPDSDSSPMDKLFPSHYPKSPSRSRFRHPCVIAVEAAGSIRIGSGPADFKFENLWLRVSFAESLAGWPADSESASLTRSGSIFLCHRRSWPDNELFEQCIWNRDRAIAHWRTVTCTLPSLRNRHGSSSVSTCPG